MNFQYDGMPEECRAITEKLSETWESRNHEKETQNKSTFIVLTINWNRGGL